jgi:hypothetical protein
MTKQATSTSEVERSRARRGLGPMVGAAACAAALAFAPAASAQTGNNPLGGIEGTLANTVLALPSVVGDPLGGDNGGPGGFTCQADLGLGASLTCLVDGIDRALGGQRAQTRKIKARARTRVLRTNSARWTLRLR